MARMDPATGRYIYLTIDDLEYRVYFEEAGSGIPLLLQHTAGSDGRQWRHLLADLDLAKDYRIIAYDLPYHGKSVPPLGKEWWREQYKLRRDFLMQVPVTLSKELGLERPVFMGSSIGGHLALDLALYHPDEFRAVIGLEAAAETPGSYQEIFNHPRVSNAFKANVMYGLMAPSSPEQLRRETTWCYSQGAPPVFKGDLYYHDIDHAMGDSVGNIDTSKLDVFMLTGEYDWATPPDMSEATAKKIEGAYYQTMEGLGHFPMSEDPERFMEYVRPILSRIHAQQAAA